MCPGVCPVVSSTCKPLRTGRMTPGSRMMSIRAASDRNNLPVRRNSPRWIIFLAINGREDWPARMAVASARLVLVSADVYDWRARKEPKWSPSAWVIKICFNWPGCTPRDDISARIRRSFPGRPVSIRVAVCSLRITYWLPTNVWIANIFGVIFTELRLP